MLRVAIPAILCLSLAACSGAYQPETLGFAGAGGAQNIFEGQRDASADGTSRESAASQRIAARADEAPNGSWKKAPKDALADRDFSGTRIDTRTALKFINEYRLSNGLKPLKLDAQLTRAAKAHSNDLAKWDRISHYGSDGTNPWDRIKRSGYKARLAAENVGTGQASFEEVLKGWQKSKGHDKNLLLADAEHMGIALVNDPKTEFKTFWTLLLGAPI